MTKVVRELLAAGYPVETPVAVVYRVGWPEEKVIRGDLSDIAAKIRESKITLQALIMVGEAMNPRLRDPLPASEQPQATSHLYSQDYTHLYRRSPSRPDTFGPRIKSGDERVPQPKVPLSDVSGGP